MRCMNCGFPVSPSRTSCPRCGAAINQGNDGRVQGGQGPGTPTPMGNGMYPPAAGAPVGQPVPGQQWQQGPGGGAGGASYNPQMQQLFANNGRPGPQPYASPPGFNGPAGSMASTNVAQPRAPQRSSRLPLTIAGISVFIGAIMLILVFVFASAFSQTSNDNHKTTVLPSPTSAPQQVVSGTTPTPDAQATPTDTAPTPTPTTDPGQYPASQYVSDAQMAHSVDMQTAKPTDTGDTFQAGQKMYVTFGLPAGKGGAACLQWYIGDQQFATYPIAVKATSTRTYSYAITGGKGQGHVEIYWASSTACSDKQLAQKVNYTVQ
ncbi:zinc ribbon domain-containing protein [Ktedonobacter sp. SOSP1-52]|uniref:zinc ribbon domain-containing protein n=1 Tax=Ktedonobacter sp. SOSP1-52 TaxID=2778366 RepID=UPI001915565A|nr:zinc ribbon domain-containing protein [Ktedonobacter sp. SOSP1-52]